MSNEDAQPSSFGDLISVKQAADIIGLTPRHVRLLITREIIWGVKMGRDWFTTEQVIQEYMALDRRPGPKTGR